MPQQDNAVNKLVIAISSRALFDLDASHKIYEEQGVAAYAQYQIENEDVPLEAGVAFSLVKKLLQLKHQKTQEPLVDVILLSRNNADTGLRIFNSIKHHQLNISRAAFTQGESPYRYVTAFNAHLFLSADPADVRRALEAGCAAASIFSSNKLPQNTDNKLRIAFDGDAVLFSDEAEKIFQAAGLDAFTKAEQQAAHRPLMPGPFKGFLQALHNLQQHFSVEDSPIRTALVTARSAPTHERVVRTLRSWNIRLDESIFLGGLNKTVFLKAFGADFFFDDQPGHCLSASEHIATGHVPHGITNSDDK